MMTLSAPNSRAYSSMSVVPWTLARTYRRGSWMDGRTPARAVRWQIHRGRCFWKMSRMKAWSLMSPLWIVSGYSFAVFSAIPLAWSTSS